MSPQEKRIQLNESHTTAFLQSINELGKDEQISNDSARERVNTRIREGLLGRSTELQERSLSMTAQELLAVYHQLRLPDGPSEEQGRSAYFVGQQVETYATNVLTNIRMINTAVDAPPELAKLGLRYERIVSFAEDLIDSLEALSYFFATVAADTVEAKQRLSEIQIALQNEAALSGEEALRFKKAAYNLDSFVSDGTFVSGVPDRSHGVLKEAKKFLTGSSESSSPFYNLYQADAARVQTLLSAIDTLLSSNRPST